MLKKAKTAEASLRAAPLHDAPRDDLGSGLAGPSGAASGAAKKRKRGSSSQRVGQIEGQELRLEERGSEGARGSYRRYIVTCPYHTDADALCWKKTKHWQDADQVLGAGGATYIFGHVAVKSRGLRHAKRPHGLEAWAGRCESLCQAEQYALMDFCVGDENQPSFLVVAPGNTCEF